MKKLVYLIVLMFVFASSFVLGDITLSEPLDVYNLGDRLYVNADGLRGAESGNLNVNLVCGMKSTNLVRLPATSFPSGEDSSWNFYKILEMGDLEILNSSDILGECQVVTSLGTSVASTKTFSISKDVVVTASLDKSSYDPGEAISINVEAVKANGNLLNGFVEGSNAYSFTKAVEAGSVSEVFSMSETAETGIYYLNFRVYDVGRSGVLNEGMGIVSFTINQVASSVIMSLSDVVAVPGDEFTIGAEIYDQSGKEMTGTVSLEVISPDGELIESSVVSGDFVGFDFDLNSSVGTWRAIVSFNGIGVEREFEMAEVQKVDFDIEDSVLSVTNVGNVLFNRTIVVEIGEEEMELELKIEKGEVRKFNLGAPEGEYEVFIDDGEETISRQVLLTGNAIAISDFRDFGIFKEYSIVWIFLIVVLGGIGFVFFMKFRKTKKVKPKVGVVGKIKEKISKKVKPHVDSSLNFTNKSPVVQGLDVKSYSGEDKSMVDMTKKHIGSAEASLVTKGEKYMSAVVAISVKNHEELSDVAKEALHNAVSMAQTKNGLVDWRGDYVFIVFSPIITRTYHNEILATKAGMEILNTLNDYNRKFRDKIKFGLGVHVGELVASKVDGKLKYTSIGNTISLTKRISDSVSGKMIVSEEIRKKLMRELKTVKWSDVGGNLTYEVSEIKDRFRDAARLKDLLSRQQ